MYQVPRRKNLLTKLFKPLEHTDDSLIYLAHIILSRKEKKGKVVIEAVKGKIISISMLSHNSIPTVSTVSIPYGKLPR